MRPLLKLLASGILLGSIFARFALAEPIPGVVTSAITIKDTSGQVRAERTVDVQGEASDVSFQVADSAGNPIDASSLPADQIEKYKLTLKNLATGEEFSAYPANGIVSFASVTPGEWQISALAGSDVVFSNPTILVALGAGAAAGGAATIPLAAIVGGGAAAAGGAVAISSATDGGNSGDDVPPLSPFQ